MTNYLLKNCFIDYILLYRLLNLSKKWKIIVLLVIVPIHLHQAPEELLGILRRLSRMIRGIGDPLAAHYARCYVCTKARELCPGTYKELMFETLNDFLFSFKQVLGFVGGCELYVFILSNDYNTLYC